MNYLCLKSVLQITYHFLLLADFLIQFFLVSLSYLNFGFKLNDFLSQIKEYFVFFLQCFFIKFFGFCKFQFLILYLKTFKRITYFLNCQFQLSDFFQIFKGFGSLVTNFLFNFLSIVHILRSTDLNLDLFFLYLL